MALFKQSERLMQFSSSLGKDTLLIESLTGREQISRLFEFHAELLATVDTEVDVTKIVGSKVTVTMGLSDAVGSRYFNGIVARFEQGASDDEFDSYQAQIVPSLWQLTLSSNCRVFQGKTVMDIVKEVISPYGLAISDKTSFGYKPLDYCTQYDESDFNFISRIMEQHGVFYWFQHSESDNVLCFGDGRDIYPPCPISSEIPYAPQGSGREGAYGTRVSEFTSVSAMVPGKHTLNDYDFRSFNAGTRKLGTQSSSSPFGKNAYEQYAYPAGEQGYVKLTDKKHPTPDHGTNFLQARLLASDATAEVYQGKSNARSFHSGFTFSLKDHHRSGWNRKYLITELQHYVTQAPSYRAASDSREGYSNQFHAIKSDLVFKSAAVTPKPFIYGPQTAKVMVPSGEEQAVDKLGRVCIRFFWDRARKDNEMDNTWVRVAQPWAGSGWGFFFWPRANDEVIVQFIDGDPDSPVVIGSVYNGDNQPKYALPDNSTRSGIYTRSTKGGGAANANELRFEDKMGSEQVYLNAERDMDLRVENDQRRFVGGKDSLIVKGDQSDEVTGKRNQHTKSDQVEKIDGKADLDVGSNLSEKVGQNYSLKVGMNHAEKVGMNYALDAGTEVYIKAGMSLVIESGMELCLKGAGGFITIGPTGIAISGTMVMINSGGAALSGSPANLTDPGAPAVPDEADDGTKGGKK